MVNNNPSVEQLNSMLNGLNDMLKPLTDRQMEMNEAAVKLAMKPISQKSSRIDGVDCLIQYYEDNVRVVFPSRDVCKQYYDNFNTKPANVSWFKRLKNRWFQ